MWHLRGGGLPRSGPPLYTCLLMKHLYRGLRKQPGGSGGGRFALSPELSGPQRAWLPSVPSAHAPPCPSQEPPAQRPGRTPQGPALSPLPVHRREGGRRAQLTVQGWRLGMQMGVEQRQCARRQVRATDGGRAGPGWLPDALPAPDPRNASPSLSSEQLLEVNSSSSPRSGNRGKETEAREAR